MEDDSLLVYRGLAHYASGTVADHHQALGGMLEALACRMGSPRSLVSGSVSRSCKKLTLSFIGFAGARC